MTQTVENEPKTFKFDRDNSVITIDLKALKDIKPNMDIDKSETNQVITPKDDKFHLSQDFVDIYRDKQPNWDVVAYITYKRTYSRMIYDLNRTEEFWETVLRVVEGIFTFRKKQLTDINPSLWNETKEQKMAQRMYELIWVFRFLPSGRVMWTMGTPFVEKNGSMSLCNCGFFSTESIATDTTAFEWTTDALMQGVGVGFDVRGAGKVIVKEPQGTQEFIIPDSREGWVRGVRLILHAYFYGESLPIFDYSKIRPEGTPIKGFGGVSGGFKPLKGMYDSIKKLLEKRIGHKLTSVNIVDIMNFIAKCVVAGNIRRSAEIALGDYDDDEYVNCKRDKEAKLDRRWASNNSVFGYEGMDYSKLIKNVVENGGEPAVIWLENAKNYSRMGRDADFKDMGILGCNPCFAGYEKLLTIDGEKTFEELNGKYTKVITPTNEIIDGKVICSGIKETIKLIFGNWSSLTLTPNHVLMTSDGREIEAKDTLEERIRVHKEPNLNFDILWVKLGFIQGDGQLTRLKGEYGHKGLEINIGKKDIEIKTLFGLDIDYSDRKYYTDEYTEQLIGFGFKSEPLPFRELPTNIPKDKELSFLRGLFSANGCIINSRGSGRIGFKCTCKKLIDQLIEMLKSYGIESYITTNKPKSVKFSNGEYLCKESYDINIVKIMSIVRFYEKIGFIQLYKQQNLEKIIINKSPKIIKIEQDIKQNVYDFQLNSIHWGYVNGFLVHNCGEIGLESGELCNLAETFPVHHNSYEEYQETLYYAYLVTKTVSLIETQWEETNRVLRKNRRIGVSQSGIIDAFNKHGRRTVLNWSKKGYEYLRKLDKEISKMYQTNESIKVTTVKPSGTVSLLAMVSSGIHYPHSEYYIRRITIDQHSELIPILKEAGYDMEECITDHKSYCVLFPKKEPNFVKSKFEASMVEQVFNVIDYQANWSDNLISVTVTFRKDEIPLIKPTLEFCEDKLKGISMLPLEEHGYQQAPFEMITKEKFDEISKKIKPIPQFQTTEEGIGENFCDSNRCNTQH